MDPSDDVAVRLTRDTEVVIAPKTRSSLAEASKKHDLGQAGTAASSSTAPLSPEVQRAKRQLLRIPPALPNGNSLLPLSEANGGATEEAVAYICTRHFKLLCQAFPSTKVSLRIKHCPGLKTDEYRRWNKTAGERTQEPARQSGGGSKGKQKALDQEGEAGEASMHQAWINVHLRGSSKVPEGSIHIDKATRTALGSGDAPIACALVRIGEPRPTPVPRPPEKAHARASSLEDDTSTISPSLTLTGMEKHLTKSLAHIRYTLVSSRGLSLASAAQPSIPTSGLLICGASGSGKTSLLSRIESDAHLDPRISAHIQRISCTSLVNLRIPQLQAQLYDVFTLASWHAPSLVVFDDLDRLVPAEMEHIDSFRSQHIASLFLNIANQAIREQAERGNYGGIVVVATAKGPEALHASLMQSHFFGERVSLSSPDKDARKQIVDALIRTKVGSSTHLVTSKDLNPTAVATVTEGYLPVDLKDLVDRSVHQAVIRAGRERSSAAVDAPIQLAMQDVAAAEKDFAPLSLRDVKLQKSDVEWQDIGGLQETRKVLRETLEWPTKYGAIFASSPLRLRSGCASVPAARRDMC